MLHTLLSTRGTATSKTVPSVFQFDLSVVCVYRPLSRLRHLATLGETHVHHHHVLSPAALLSCCALLPTASLTQSIHPSPVWPSSSPAAFCFHSITVFPKNLLPQDVPAVGQRQLCRFCLQGCFRVNLPQDPL